MKLERLGYKSRLKRHDRAVRAADEALLARHDRHEITGQISGHLPDVSGDRVALVASYPAAQGLFSLRNLCQGLARNGYQVVIVSTRPMDETLKAQVPGFCHSYLERPNFGRDFGSYAAGLNWLRGQRGFDGISRLVLANDSLFWSDRTGDEIARFEQLGSPWRCLFEKHEIGPHPYHAQSYFLGFDRAVFGSEAFASFWETYVPRSERHHAIVKGEIGLTHALLGAGFQAQPLYDFSAVWARIEEESRLGFPDAALREVLAWCLERPLRKPRRIDTAYPLSFEPDHCAFLMTRLRQIVSDGFFTQNPPHDLGVLCNALFGAPIKRDLCARYGEAIGAVVSLCSGFEGDDRRALEKALVQKGPQARFEGFDRYLLDKGRS
jgi:hypothetical protein